MNLKFRRRNFSWPFSDLRNPQKFSTSTIIGYTVDYSSHVGPEKKIYRKYDMIVYPKKTQISKSFLETISDKFKGWFTRKKKTSESKEVEEFVPMEFFEMSRFCLWSYLEEYKTIVCNGKFQQGTNIMELVDSVIYVFNSLISFDLRTQGFVTVVQEVPNKNKYRGVCEGTLYNYSITLFVVIILLYRK